MNLWTDTEHNQSPLAPATRRAKRFTEQAFLSTLRDWLLDDYVAAYCRSLAATRIFRRCYWIDALGGELKGGNERLEQQAEDEAAPPGNGRRRGTAAAPTAPALQRIVSLSQQLTQESRPITLYGLVLASGSSTRRDAKIVKGNQTDQIDQAEQNGADPGGRPVNNRYPIDPHVRSSPSGRVLALPKETGIIRASWLEAGTQLLSALDQSPGVFLLNPFGPTMFTGGDLVPLYQRTVPTELCLHLSHKQVETHLRAAQRAPVHASALTSLLRSDRWKTLSLEEEQREQSIAACIELFTMAMQKHFLLPVQRITLPVALRPALIETLPYTLLFATRRQDSLVSMNDALCCYQRHIYEQSHRGMLAEEWFATQQRERYQQALARLHERVLQQGRTQRVRRWPELRQHLLIEHFGQFTLQEYDSIILQLLVEQRVRCLWRQAPRPGEARVPGNDDSLTWI